MSSPSTLAQDQAPTQTSESQPVPSEQAPTKEKAADLTIVSTQLLDRVGEVEADDTTDTDSAFGTNVSSDMTSITSSIYAGLVENGRRYQTKREGEYWGPSDEKQWESMNAAHIVYMILDSREKNRLFRSPIDEGGKRPQNILDVGCGTGIWAKEVADAYPSAVVHGVDLYPPPETWVPANCKFEVDDVLKTWEWKMRFDLIHLRDLFGSFSDRQWTGVYKQAYENLLPGGWIEHVEAGVSFHSDDGTLPEDSLTAAWGPLFNRICTKIDKPLDTVDTFKARIVDAGFINVQERTYKVPLGGWAKNPVLKEAGKFFKDQVLDGLEGYALFLLTKFGEPTPWSPDEVQVYLAKVRNEMNKPGLHAYSFKRRVWAQKPYESKPKE